MLYVSEMAIISFHHISMQIGSLKNAKKKKKTKKNPESVSKHVITFRFYICASIILNDCIHVKMMMGSIKLMTGY